MIRPLAYPLLFVLAALLTPAPGLHAQPLTDTLLTWRSYSHDREARVRLYRCDDADRPHTVVVDERAGNPGGPVTDEARYVAEVIGRAFGFDPATATFVFRFTAAGFAPGASDEGKALLLRATFRRGTSGALNAPSWRVLSRDALAELTDRALY
ncbi:MAG TPA: hypothetical protein VK002_03340 [Rubricoccaceae bacterium]|nr:hypothetical protein [Rubricoccaceae bacterium]